MITLPNAQVHLDVLVGKRGNAQVLGAGQKGAAGAGAGGRKAGRAMPDRVFRDEKPKGCTKVRGGGTLGGGSVERALWEACREPFACAFVRMWVSYQPLSAFRSLISFSFSTACVHVHVCMMCVCVCVCACVRGFMCACVRTCVRAKTDQSKELLRSASLARIDIFTIPYKCYRTI